MAAQWLAQYVDTEWSGSGELWLDPAGNEVEQYDCAMRFDKDTLHYSWSQAGKPQAGRFIFDEEGAIWMDSWHQKDEVKCLHLPGAWGLFTVTCTYSAPSGPPWGWRIKLSQRPDGDLVLQMTNIAPWGEEGRAVRMTLSRVE